MKLKLRYGIVDGDGDIIARFEYEFYRDECLKALQERYPLDVLSPIFIGD